jgi:formylglycine-generating enzyme required for sulfatase activity
MNEYNVDLIRARAKQRRLYLGVFASISSVFLVLFIIFALMRVTSVSVLPDDAVETAVIEIKKGVGFTIGMKVYTFSANPVLDIGAKGFATRTIEIPPDHSGSLRVELIELPGKLRVVTNSVDAAIRWLINGRLVVVSDELVIDLNPGSYSLEVDSLYHDKKVMNVILTRGEEKSLSIELSPVSGHVAISSIPDGVPVIIDGEMKGVTPLSSQYIGGKYSVEIVTPDFETVTDQIEITNISSEVSRNYQLQPKKSYLNFDLIPAGGDLLLNGRKVDPASQIAINAGVKNTVTYLKDGYFLESRSITLAVGEKRKVSLNLRAEKGRVEISSNPVADVFINGKLRGKTPLTLSLLAVSHQVTLSKKGYRSIRKIITPSSKKTITFSSTLQGERIAKLAEAKRSYKNNIGMEFKLFTPSQLKMGAARHEKGQRANEFVRDIYLKKPFYAGLKEVTTSQYSQFRKWSGSAPSGNYPVTSISWLDAAAFCNWLSVREKLRPFYVIGNGMLKGINKTSNGYRLLSEAEWEWLARKAGRKYQTTFTWGNEFIVPPASGNIADETARSAVKGFIPNYNDGYEKTAPVGSFIADKAGLYDLTGNVSEWVHDYYSLVPPRKKTQEIDPLGADKGTNHVIKGSSWRSGSLTELRASFRDGAVSGREDTGFRVARYLYGAEEHGN